MKRGIIPDVHDRIDIVQLIMDKERGVEEWIHLGDYFDSFPKEGGCVRAQWTAKKVKEWLNDPRIINVAGNHDLSYGWSVWNRFHRCSGFTMNKYREIHDTLRWEDWKKFVLHYWADDFLITHAGFDRHFVKEGLSAKESVNYLCDDALQSLHGPIPYERGLRDILACGIDRDGRQFRGGVTWCGWDSLDIPEGFNQVVGHTISPTPRMRMSESGQFAVYNLDTNSSHYAILRDGELTVKEVHNLPM